MQKTFDHTKWEEEITSKWQSKKPKNKKGDDYIILMPPPNANASLHAGHAMYTVDDIMTRFKRMQGCNSQWIPGLDHAGFETQYVYEKHLAKQKKSRFDFDRKTLYENIYDFVKDNSGLIYEQFRRLGFNADWEKSVFTLDENVIKTVYSTFKKMHSQNLIYRDDYIVNYCTKDGTSLAELEVKYVTRKDSMFYIKYKSVGAIHESPAQEDGYITVATVRPEPIFADTNLAVNPKDKKHRHLVGKSVQNPLTGEEMEIIADEFVDPEFGTGIVKLTPAHDPNDFKVAKEHGLPIRRAINQRGKIINSGELNLDGLNVKQAREKVVEILKSKDLIDKIDENYEHSVSTCYKCGRDIEPLIIPNWFIKVDDKKHSLKKPVIKAIKSNETKFTPKRYRKQILQWMKNMHDWPISRQIVWGIRIPVWYHIVIPDSDPKSIHKKGNNISVSFIDKNGENHFGFLGDFLKDYSLKEIRDGLQNLIASADTEYVISEDSPGENYLPETDTFDTWFSSGQWPVVTTPANYPTDFMATYFDILKFWISRMMMFGLYLKDEVPFKDVYLWSGVVDSKGQKMSKSKGNVVNPIEYVEKYGADALRMSLMFGVSSGNKVIFSEDKIRSMRNYANKIWNIARFAFVDSSDKSTSPQQSLPSQQSSSSLRRQGSSIYVDSRLHGNDDVVTHEVTHADDEWILQELDETVKIVTENLEKFKFNLASERLYEFSWHILADQYIEKVKDRKKDASPTLKYTIQTVLQLLHPFMPFVTEAIWSIGYAQDKQELLVDSDWPM